MDDLISRQAAIDALWRALHKYEDETEKQFIASEELDVADWFQHRIFVQNMSDTDRQTILKLPSAQPEITYCKNCEYFEVNTGGYEYGHYEYCHKWGRETNSDWFCSRGRGMKCQS